MSQLHTKNCMFANKALVAESSNFGGRLPPVIDVTSDFTGKTVTFYPVQMGHPLFCEDQWDGEQMIYIPVTELKNCTHLVVYHS